MQAGAGPGRPCSRRPPESCEQVPASCWDLRRQGLQCPHMSPRRTGSHPFLHVSHKWNLVWFQKHLFLRSGDCKETQDFDFQFCQHFLRCASISPARSWKRGSLSVW